MSALAIPALVTAEEAVAVARRLARGTRVGPAVLHHHPFVGVAFEVSRPRPPRRRRHADSDTASARVHTLVDAVGGRAYLTPRWPAMWEVDAEFGTPRPTLTVEQAVGRARRTVAAQLLRARRLATPPQVRHAETMELVWKPNWTVAFDHRGRELTVLIDGLDRSHYMAG